MSTQERHILNKGQKAALKGILSWWPSRKQGVTLRGWAGTGKTYLVSILIDEFTRQYSIPKSRMVMCAPTNKAVKVQSQLNTGLTTCTIYSLLGLKMEENEDRLKLTKMERSNDTKYQIVFLDECGMITEELKEYIQQSMNRGVRYIFIGDPEQLNPIGESLSKVWGWFEEYVLTDVERHDNQILALATQIRTCKKIGKIQFKSDHSISEGVWYIPGWKFEERVRKYARLGSFKENSKAIAWRNKTVEKMNDWIREEIFGDLVIKNRYLIGDIVVFTKPYSVKEPNGKDFGIFVDDEATILDIKTGIHEHYSSLMIYHVVVDLYGKRLIVDLIHEDSESEMDKILTELAAKAREPGQGVFWKTFWGLRNSLAAVKYSSALTAHRAQGSSYRNTFVDSNDILCNPTEDECRRCLYVAGSRARKKVFLG